MLEGNELLFGVERITHDEGSEIGGCQFGREVRKLDVECEPGSRCDWNVKPRSRCDPLQYVRLTPEVLKNSLLALEAVPSVWLATVRMKELECDATTCDQ